MDRWGAFECTILVETVLHLETGKIGPQENYNVDKFVGNGHPSLKTIFSTQTMQEPKLLTQESV